MESSVFLIGFSTFLLGFIIGAAVIYITQKKNEDVSLIKTKLGELQTVINQRDGSFQTILNDIKNEKDKFSEIAQELQITLIRGSSKKQGTWGEKVIKEKFSQ